MNVTSCRRLSFWFALLCVTSIGASSIATHAWAAATKAAPSAVAPTVAPPATVAPTASTPAAASSAAPATDSPPAQDDFNDEADTVTRHGHRHRWRGRNDGSVVSVGHNGHLESGQRADSVVSIFGSSTSEGEANDVVSVVGNTRVTGPVHDSAVAVLGNTYVDSKVDGDVVSVLGNVELGPNAEVGGDVVSVLGVVKRDPAAIVHGGIQRVLDVDVGGVSGLGWLNSWIAHCLLYLRPLAFAPGLGWAWTLALGFLAFYACLALMFRPSLETCVHTLETQPGHTALAALLTMLLTPVLMVLLCITLIGIAAVPFVVAALFCAGLFGKAVMLAWLGGRITGSRPGAHPAVAVLVGGAIVLVLYVIPVVGFLVYKLLGFFGLGAVVYTLILRTRERRAATRPPPAGAAGATTAGVATDAVASARATSAGTASAGTTSAGATMAGAGWTAGPAAASAAAPPPSPAAGSIPPGDAGTAAAGTAAAPPPSAMGAAQFSAAMPRAGFWVRMAALLLDVILVGFLMNLLHPFGNVHIVVLAIYGAVMWKLRGTTVGGIVFDLHVVRIDGRPIEWETAIVRALGCILSLCVVGLGFIWIAFDHNNQAWHDKIAGTVVVQAKRGAPLV